MYALKKLNLKDVIFIDIETARLVKELEIDTPLFDSWQYKVRKETNDEVISSYNKEAALYPEFARIVCISVGRIKGNKISIRTYNQENEAEMLEAFCSDLEKVTDAAPKTAFCGHAVNGFDIPFIFKRCLINQVEPHILLDTAHLKPWETTAIDTKDLWKGTSFSPASLINIAVAFGIPSPKDDISGAEVGDVYWSDDENRIERISRYCEKDVLTTANVVRKCRFESLLEVDSKNEPEVIEKNPLIKHLFDGGKYDSEHKDKLVVFIKSLDEENANKVYTILESIVSTASGKRTKFTKVHVKELRELCQK